MKIERKLTIGQNEYLISVDAEGVTDFFKTMSFFDSLPKVGPNGETDLVLSYRTPKNYEYFSIVSQKAQQEFKFGQHKDRPGSLFAKGWEPLYKSDDQEEGAVSNPTVGLGAPVANYAPAPHAVTSNQKAPVQSPKAATPQPPTQVQNQAAAILSKFGI